LKINILSLKDDFVVFVVLLRKKENLALKLVYLFITLK